MVGTTSTRQGKIQADELATTIRTELNSALESDETVDKLVSAIRKTIISDITPIITRNVAEALKASFEFELHERDDRIDALENELKSIRLQNDEAEQYSRRNCLIFQGVTEADNENTDETIVKLCKEKMDIEIECKDLDRSHRLGHKKGDKPRGIIAKFANYHSRDKIYRARTLLRKCEGTPVFIHESLTKSRSELFWKVKTAFKDHVKVVWTQDGRIIARLKTDDKKVVLTNNDDLRKLKDKSNERKP